MRRLLFALPLAALFRPAQAQAPSMTPRELVLAFFEQVFVQKQVEAGFARFVGPTYTQHNPRVPDGPEAAIRFLAGRFRDNPEASNRLARVIAEGDLVVLHHHSRASAADRGAAIVDIYRVADGRIVEHWDVIQPVPESAANPNGMF